MDEPRNPPPPLERERWLLSEQSEAERARTEQRLSPPERERLRAEDEQLRAALFARIPPSRFRERVEAQARTPTPTRRVRTYSLTALTATVAALAAVLLLRRPEPAAPVERAKGLELDLRVYRKRADGVERLSDGAQVAAHDVLQLGYIRDRYAFGVLLSIDGRGAVTLHQPTEASASSALPSAVGQQLLPDAYELDDAPGFERFVLVAAEQPLAVEQVLRAAHELAEQPSRVERAPLSLPVPTVQRSLLLRKREPR